jgi:LPXTG-motif cell wall-anchored protein
MLGRVDTDRITDLVADLSVADLVTSVASAADRMGDQVGTVVDQGRRTSQTTRLVLAAGIVVIVIGGVVLIRRRRNVDTPLDVQPRSGGAANPN